ncbi:MAG: DUF3618 domain-containing protein [Hamadaea sp.]|uniref:DUF3618 domain-containing protein n=1 Tax=Hamadaea sp. NPDC050747 TaxID=3155789 RepID=UPI0017F2776D|nr:DUF3618 domain-containing protein [Hamadaea sp.]NUR49216.1 DUF3618 domain-containing protein [Hamadaea sp.]NUT07004.1 DUF3618 domain-containing protein [Hamadaea sp.]
MTTHNGQPQPMSVAELSGEIAQTRQALGETVRALAAKADVKSRAEEFVQDTRDRAAVSVREHRTQLAAIGIGLLAVVGAVLIWRNREAVNS